MVNILYFSSPELKAHIISQLLEQVHYDINISVLCYIVYDSCAQS